jgi:hypothetical protein
MYLLNGFSTRRDYYLPEMTEKEFRLRRRLLDLYNKTARKLLYVAVLVGHLTHLFIFPKDSYPDTLYVLLAFPLFVIVLIFSTTMLLTMSREGEKNSPRKKE